MIVGLPGVGQGTNLSLHTETSATRVAKLI